MQYIKNSVFLYLSPRQKAQLMSFLKSFAKKHIPLLPNCTADDLIDKFIEEENYYNEVQNPHFEFVLEYFENEEFLIDLKKYFEYIFWEIGQKKLQQPLIDRQKEIMKQQRKKAADFKLKKLPPTKKQLWYYEKVAKAHHVEMKPLEGATRLDLRDWIKEIIES